MQKLTLSATFQNCLICPNLSWCCYLDIQNVFVLYSQTIDEFTIINRIKHMFNCLCLCHCDTDTHVSLLVSELRQKISSPSCQTGIFNNAPYKIPPKLTNTKTKTQFYWVLRWHCCHLHISSLWHMQLSILYVFTNRKAVFSILHCICISVWHTHRCTYIYS